MILYNISRGKTYDHYKQETDTARVPGFHVRNVVLLH